MERLSFVWEPNNVYYSGGGQSSRRRGRHRVGDVYRGTGHHGSRNRDVHAVGHVGRSRNRERDGGAYSGHEGATDWLPDRGAKGVDAWWGVHWLGRLLWGLPGNRGLPVCACDWPLSGRCFSVHAGDVMYA